MNTPRMVLIAFLLVAGIGVATAVHAGQTLSQTNIGSDFLTASPACPARELPALESIALVPPIFDPAKQANIEWHCLIRLVKDEKPRKNVKGLFTAEVVVRDNNTGMLMAMPIRSGKLKTDTAGSASFNLNIPASVLGDGFASGDESAWYHFRVAFTSKKKINDASVRCSVKAAKSNS